MSSSSQAAGGFSGPSFTSSSQAIPSQAQPAQSTEKGKERDVSAVDGKKEAEFKKRDKTLGEFMVMLDDYKPLVR
jgi:hypothetical protein